MNARPKVILTLLCRNEADIIAANIEFHLSCGVDFIIVTDNASNDGTTDILHSYEKRNLLRLLHQPELTHDQATWVTRMACLATREHAAEWLIHADADEFWYPVEGSLPEALGAVPDHVTALAVGRTNFLPPLAGSPESLPFFQRQLLREVHSVNSLGKPLPTKICHRSHSEMQVDDGNHRVRCGGKPVKPLATDRVEILHFPVRSLAQLERKISAGAQALERNNRIDLSVGSTWRHLYQVLQRDGSLAGYYTSLTRTPEQIEADLASGALIEDCRLQERLAASHLVDQTDLRAGQWDS